MPSARDLKKKIRSITNTKKITRTMELVATAKSKRAQVRVNANTPYSQALGLILKSLAEAGTVEHPLLEQPAESRGPAGGPSGKAGGRKAPKVTVVFVVSANRGMCGGYNTNVLALAGQTIRQEEGAGNQVEVYMAGRKGIVKFRFQKIPVAQRFLNLDDKATFAEADEIAGGLLDRFLKGEVARVVVVSTRYYSAGVQKPVVTQLLPIAAPKPEAEAGAGGAAGKRQAAPIQYIFEPDPRTMLEALLPQSVKANFYRLILEATISEQIARRLAMKMATDNAEEIIKHYTRNYNRARQAGITQQISEIVSGANALE